LLGTGELIVGTLNEAEQNIIYIVIGASVGALIVLSVVGALIGRRWTRLAVLLVGIIAGGNIGSWFYEIVVHISTTLANLPESATGFIAGLVILIGAFLGWWSVRHYPVEALILITVVLGVHVLVRALPLNPDASLTGIVMLSLALLGVVFQYADYIREQRGRSPFAYEEPPLRGLSFEDLE
jgi:hypothetical protein